MSDQKLPFDVQSEIIKWLPEKSLLQFRTVSIEWMAHIDKFHSRRLLVCYESYGVRRYAYFIDGNDFPQMIPLTAPESLRSLRNPITLASDAGLTGFYELDSRVVIWNPTVQKFVSIDVNPNEGYEHTVVGFGVCHGDLKLVKISVKETFDGTMWDVDVFSRNTQEWRKVHTDVEPVRRYKLECAKVCLNGVIYFRAYVDNPRYNFFMSFNLESEAFGVVPFPENLEHAPHVHAAKVHDSLGILHYHDGVCDVWTKKEGANETFNMKYAVEVEGRWLYWNNGQVVLEFMNGGVVLEDDNLNLEESRIGVYNPSSGGHITIDDIGINGTRHRIVARSYMQTEYLSDEPEPEPDIIHQQQ